MEPIRPKHNLSVVVLCGGVGGARMVRAMSRVVEPHAITAIVNVGDDEDVYGTRVCADLDTVLYTVAGVEGDHGWGRADDTFGVMDELARRGLDTSFLLGDKDLALCLERTRRLDSGDPLSAITADLAQRFAVAVSIVPASDDRIATKLKTDSGVWLDFQDYFVRRRHADPIVEVRFDEAERARPAPGVIEAIDRSDIVIIAPSNPVVSIGPILAVPGVEAHIARHPTVIAVSPLFGGNALKGPAAALLETLGWGRGNDAIASIYKNLINHLVVDEGDAKDVGRLANRTLRVHAMSTMLTEPDAASHFVETLLETVVSE